MVGRTRKLLNVCIVLWCNADWFVRTRMRVGGDISQYELPWPSVMLLTTALSHSLNIMIYLSVVPVCEIGMEIPAHLPDKHPGLQLA